MPKSSGKQLVDQVAKLLQSKNIPFKQDTAIRGLPVDFLVQKPDGKKVVIQAEAWDPVMNNQAVLQR